MTFKDKSITKLYAFAMAAVFALVLAGCGGGGGSATAPDPEPPAMPEPTPQEMCEGDGGRYNADGSCTSAEELAAEMAEAEALSGAQEAAMAAYMAAMAAVGGAKDPVAMGNAQMEADKAKGASDDAAMATTSEMAMEYQMKAEMYRDMAMEAAGMRGLGVTMLANKQLNGDDITNAELDGSTPPPAQSNAKNVGAAMAAAGVPATTVTTDTAFTNQGGNSATGTPADTIAIGTAIGAEPAPTEVVEHKAGGSTFALNIGAVRLLTGETPSRFETRGGWEAQDLLMVNAADAANPLKSHLVVSTDIQATTEKRVYSGAGTALPDTAVLTGDIPSDGSDFEVLLNVNPTDNQVSVTAQIFCPDSATGGCAISVNEDGEIVENDEYQYRTATSTMETDDEDYLAWGFWVTGSTLDSLTGTTPANTAPAAQAGAFAYGSDTFTVVAGNKGKATYNGVANGLYSAGGMVEYFDADATLEANFGGATNTAPLAVISGSISNIKAAGQAVDGSLTLEKTNIEAAGTIGTATTPGTTDGVLGGNGFRGQWGGQLYGPDGATKHPTTVAGTFSAATQDDKMSILGAFGAWKAE